MEKMSKEDRIAELFNSLDESEKVYGWNEYCDRNSYYEDRIYPMSELDMYIGSLSDYTVGELLNRFQLDDFDIDHDYFRDTIYGIESISDVDCVIDVDDFVRYCIRHDDALGNGAIRDILDDDEDDLEDEE